MLPLFLLFLLLLNVITNLSSTFLDPLLVNFIQKGPGHKKYIKLIVDINVRAKTMECLEENTGEILCYFVLGSHFLGVTPRA